MAKDNLDEAEDKNATSDTTRIQSVVETANAEDENDSTEEKDTQDDDSAESADDKSEADSTDENSEDNSDEEDEEEDDAKTDKDDESKDDKKSDKSTGEHKFKQFADEDPQKHISNLEKAYSESSSEAVRLNTELGQQTRRIDALMAAVGKDPDLADKLTKALGGDDSSSGGDGQGDGAPSPATDPFLTAARTDWQEKSEKEVAEIVEANPELVSDPNLNAEVKHWMEVISREEYQKHRKVITGGEAMTRAMKLLNVEDKRSGQKTASAVKDLAAPTRPRGTRKAKPASKDVSDSAYKFGELMGVSREKVEKYAQ